MLFGSKKVIKNSKEVKKVLGEITPAIKMLQSAKACAPNLGNSVQASIIVQTEDAEIPYSRNYLNISLRFDNVNAECALDKVFYATVSTVMSQGFTQDVYGLLGTFAKVVFLSTVEKMANAFLPLVNSNQQSSNVEIAYKVLTTYKRINSNQIGFFGFKVPIPLELFDVELADGRRGVSKENLNEYIDLIKKI